VGPADYFTGAVRIDPLFQAPDPAGVRGASTFELGARAAWHTHPLGQTLIVTSGRGWAQVWGGPVEEINPADVVWFPPGEQDGHIVLKGRHLACGLSGKVFASHDMMITLSHPSPFAL